LQLNNDTAFAGPYGMGNCFYHDFIIVGFHGGAADFGEIGPLMLTYTVRHEIGHWVSFPHHSPGEPYEFYTPRIVCPMHPWPWDSDRFCAFCRDARARMSFISYYNRIVELLSKNQTEKEISESELNDALQLFYDWEYLNAVEKIASIYFGLDTTPPNIISLSQTPPPDNVLPEDEVKVNATVTDDLSGVKG